MSMNKTSLWKRILLAPLMVLGSLALILVSYAYFTIHTQENFNTSVNIELLFDRLTSDALTEYQNYIFTESSTNTVLKDNNTAAGSYNYTFYYPDQQNAKITLSMTKTVDEDGAQTVAVGEITNSYTSNEVKWGTEYNPYIISDKRHLQNLSALNNSGYFKQYFLDTDTNNIPHFMVSTTEGKNVVINASGVTIEPIGSDNFGFVGSVRGALLAESTDAPLSITATNGTTYTVDTSVIYNAQVVAGAGFHDVGLFGYVGFTGEEPEDSATQFTGSPSVIQGFTLMDVSVRATHNLFDMVADDFADWLDVAAHDFKLFTLTEDNEISHSVTVGTNQVIYQETHHVGLIAGHIEYTTVKDISIFYSDTTICALEIDAYSTLTENHAFSNYYSYTGVFGTVNHLNATVTIDANAKKVINTDDGISDVDLGGGGAGGGGVLSGNLPGYVLAENLFSTYCYNADGTQKSGDSYRIVDGNRLVYQVDDDGELVLDENNQPIPTGSTAPLVAEDNSILYTHYYFTDGVFTFALSSENDTIEKIWTGTIPSFKVDSGSANWEYYPKIGSYDYTLTPVTFETIGSTNYEYYLMAWKNGDDLVLFDLAGNNDISNPTPGVNISGLSDNATSAGGSFYFTSTVELSKHAITTVRDNSNNTVVSHGNKLGVANSGSEMRSYSGTKTSFTERYLLFFTTTFNVSYNLTFEGNATDGYTIYQKDMTFNDNTVDGIIYVNTDNGEVWAYHTPASGTIQKFFFYGVQKEDNSVGGFTSNSSTATSYNANEYVLWPQSLAANGATTSTLPNYSLVKLSDLGNADWKDMNGQKLTSSSINRYFNLKSGVKWGVNFSIFNINIGSEGIVNAPVGAGADKTAIPTGCVAFQINEMEAEVEYARVRVIVAIPNNPTGTNLDGFGMDPNSDFYFGIWQGNSTSGFSFTSFDRDEAYLKFQMPRSVLKSNSTAGLNNYINVQTATVSHTAGVGNPTVVTPTGETKRTYVDGDAFLMAYEFNIPADDIGIYFMGASNSPMQIVYFSVDGVADEGFDGTYADGLLGSIDYVYANSANKILTVDKKDTTGSVEENVETYYYPSHWFIYTDNLNAINDVINYEKFYARRYIKNSTRYVYCKIICADDGDGVGDVLGSFRKYASNGDSFETGTEPTRGKEDPE